MSSTDPVVPGTCSQCGKALPVGHGSVSCPACLFLGVAAMTGTGPTGDQFADFDVSADEDAPTDAFVDTVLSPRPKRSRDPGPAGIGLCSSRQTQYASDVSAMRSADPKVAEPAWDMAYEILWREGMLLARWLLSGIIWESQREDIVATALIEVQNGLLVKRTEVFNQLSTLDDVVSMTKLIVRRRILDFYRARARSREDLVEKLPELGQDFDEPRHSRADLEEMIDRLDPPKPQLFRARFFVGRTTREIAEQFGLPHGTVCQHFAEGLRLLREWLGD